MKRLVDWIQGFAVTLGGPGLFLIGFLDSSFLSFPEVIDLLVILMVAQHKERLLYYSLMATLGSLAGCLALYYVARRGGEAFIRKRFNARHVEVGLKLFRKYGLLAVIVPALLPPPAPFKIFILLAGVAAIPVWQFTAAVFIARFVRYGGEGLLAVFYGERAAAFLEAHAKEAGLWLSGIALVLGAAWILFSRRRQRRVEGRVGEQ
jgi:membrane protein YqaA with SNARE-associated domain